jgi:membrane-associated phospholipid phosphatase
MTYLTPIQRSRLHRRQVRVAVVAFVTIVVLALFDRAAFHATYVGARLADDGASVARERLGGRDWYQVLRGAGNLIPWIVVAAAIGLVGSARRDRAGESGARFSVGAVDAAGASDSWLPVRLIASAALAGGIADAIKPLIGRVRPMFTDGRTEFRVLGGFRELAEKHLSFGLPSSHAAVAFGAACALSFAWPRLAWVLGPLAAGCAYSRLASGAHFLTDVLVGALLGYACARVFRAGGWFGKVRGGVY